MIQATSIVIYSLVSLFAWLVITSWLAIDNGKSIVFSIVFGFTMTLVWPISLLAIYAKNNFKLTSWDQLIEMSNNTEEDEAHT